MMIKGKQFLTLAASVALCCFVVAPFPVLANWPEAEELSPLVLGMGGAARAMPGPIHSARINPAGIAAERGVFGQTSYATSARQPLDVFTITLVDNISSPIAGAFQYYRFNGDMEREDVGLTFAGGRTGLKWGFTGRYVHGRDKSESDWQGAVVGDVGFMIMRPSGLRIAFVGHDLFASTLDFLTTRLAIAAAYDVTPDLTFSADFVRDFDDSLDEGQNLHLGAKYAVGETGLTVMAGQMWESSSDRDRWSAGIIYSLRSLGLGYATQKTRQVPGEFLHVFEVSGSF